LVLWSLAFYPFGKVMYDRWPVWSYADLVQNQLYELVAH
jgi:hypothetical protein